MPVMIRIFGERENLSKNIKNEFREIGNWYIDKLEKKLIILLSLKSETEIHRNQAKFQKNRVKKSQ